MIIIIMFIIFRFIVLGFLAVYLVSCSPEKNISAKVENLDLAQVVKTYSEIVFIVIERQNVMGLLSKNKTSFLINFVDYIIFWKSLKLFMSNKKDVHFLEVKTIE